VVEWIFKAGSRTLVVRSRCYFVPNAKARLISPQRLFDKSKGVTGRYIVEEDKSTLSFDGCDDLIIDYDARCFLPIAMARNQSHSMPQANLSIPSDDNQNLIGAQKLLLDWHY